VTAESRSDEAQAIAHRTTASTGSLSAVPIRKGGEKITASKCDAIYRKHAPILVGYLRAAYKASLADAEDAVHDAFEALYRSQHEVRAPQAWLMKVAMRNYVESRRRSDKLNPLSDVDPEEPDSDPQRDRPPESEPPLTERTRTVLEAVAGLSPRRRKVLELMLLGLDEKEIAAQLNIAQVTVRSTLSQSHSRIRDELRTAGLLDDEE
jgi:RNA polymerase sigma factor (sigma-70 family)